MRRARNTDRACAGFAYATSARGTEAVELIVEREAAPHAEDSGRRGGREGREGRPKVRAKPGAALANAKRETVGIVPSQGKKIVF